MRFEATKSDLIAEARAALAAADRELRPNPRSHTTQRRQSPEQPPAPEPAVDEHRLEERQRVIDSIAEELAAINESALEHARDEMEAAINRYVTASSVYNRILAEMRQQLREVGGLSEDDINYRSESGRPGLRVKGIVRVQALPWQTVSQTALAALRIHAPVDRPSLDSPADADLDDLAPLRARAQVEAAEPPVEIAADVAPVTVDREQIETIVEEMIGPVLAFIRDQQGEITLLRSDTEQQSGEIAMLREQAQRQAEAAERITAYFDALREAQTRLQ